MKKWHMEGIIISGGQSAGKLELPAKSWKIRWASVVPGSENDRKDPVFSRYVKTAANKVVSILK